VRRPGRHSPHSDQEGTVHAARPTWVPPTVLLVLVASALVVRSQFSGTPVEVATVSRGDLAVELVTTGVVEAKVTDTGFQLPGRLTAVYVDEGDRVEAGQVLAELAATDLKAAVDQAAAAVAAADAKQVGAAEGAAMARESTSAQFREARAVLSAGRADQQKLERGARTEELKQAEAATVQAEAAVVGARAQLQGAQTAEELQRSLSDAQAARAQAELKAARAQRAKLAAGARPQELQAARAAVRDAEARQTQAKRDWERAQQLFAQGAVPAQVRDGAETAHEITAAGVSAAREQLKLLEAGTRQEDREAALAQVQAAEALVSEAEAGKQQEQLRRQEAATAAAQVKRAEAALEQARQALALVRAGARREDRTAAAAQVSRADAGVDAAKAAQRQRAIAGTEKQAAAALSAQAAAALEAAQAQYEKTRLRAPFAGTVARKHRELGDSVAPGMPVFTLVDSRRMWVVAEVDDEDLGKIAAGQEVAITSEAYPGESVPGTVVSIGPLAQDKEELLSTTKIVRVRVEVGDPDRKLKPGLEVDLEGKLVVKRGAVLAPNNGIVRHRQKKYAFVVNGRRVQKRELKLGPDSYERTVVVEGLSPGEIVVTVGKEALKEGSRIKIVTRGDSTK